MSKYIKVELNDHGYEIYEVNGEIIRRFKPQYKIIMRKVLKEFDCLKQPDNTLIYYDHDLIMVKYQKEKRLSQPKKVNRIKSKQIIAGFLILAAILGGNAIKNIIEEDETPPTKTEQPTRLEETSLNPSWISNPSYEEQDDINEFYYEFDKPNDKEALINSEEYMEIYQKYEKMYGVDADLLCAIGAQESSGIHYNHSTNGGHATGIMGIENIWKDESIRVFNFEKNEYETITVDYSKIGDLDYNIKIGASIFQNYFYNTLKNSDDIDVEETDYLPFTLQKYNMGPGNMWKALEYEGNWIDNRDMINAGDKYYFEHVLSRFDNETVIKIRLTDGSYYSTKLTNLSLEKHHSRN